MLSDLIRRIQGRWSPDGKYYRIIHEMLGVTPRNIELYKVALIHRSASIVLSTGQTINNERLEFLGDAILESIVSDYLFIEFPDEHEGFLTQMRSRIVSRASLNELACRIGLDRYVIAHNTFTQKHIWGDALEAMIGAIYLDRGYEYVNRLVIDLIRHKLDMVGISHTETDYKSRLIEWCQKSKRDIVFDTCPTTKTSSREPCFRSTILIDGLKVGSGTGSTKKEAEQQAARVVSGILNDEVGDRLLERLDHACEHHYAK